MIRYLAGLVIEWTPSIVRAFSAGPWRPANLGAGKTARDLVLLRTPLG